MSRTAQEILHDMGDMYSRCDSYRDTGDVVRVLITTQGSAAKRRTTSHPFRTLFIRPQLFRFQFRERTIGPESEWERYTVSRTYDGVEVFWTVQYGRDSPETLERALAGATGVSGGSAFTIPSLLLPDEVGQKRWTDNCDAVNEAEEDIDGEPCWRLRISDPQGLRESRLIWIGCRTLLLRKITTRIDLHAVREQLLKRSPELATRLSRPIELPAATSAHSETTTTYSPELNVPIDSAEFTRPL